ncbi:MAG: ABC-F family ATP-binding cassette domain-containing protein [Chloroflexi bacterium]|nr:ABC-F family ATP-binding cassette domain-containing protein [Chloroflexota bacterium]
MPLVSASDLSVSYGTDLIFENLNLDIHEHARIGIVGPNGGGKTSLLRVIVKELEPNAGRVQWSRGLRVGYVSQAPTPSDGTLNDEIAEAFHRLRSLEQGLEASALELERAANGDGNRDQAEVEERYATQLSEYEALGGYTYENDMERMAEALGLGREVLETPSSSASGGERTRAALACALLSRPDLLVLDEPTNHLDLNGVTWLEGFLDKIPSAVVVVSHDRYFLERTIDQVWELDHGRLETFPGKYAAYRELREERIRRQAQEYKQQQEYIAKEEAFIRRYRAGQKAMQARGRETRLQRLERVQRPERDTAIAIGGLSASRTGQVVLSTRGLEVGFVEGETQTRLLSVPDLKLERGSRTALIGDNGVGKTTLIKTILGLTPPLGGSVDLGHNVTVGYYRQGLEDLPDDSTVLEAFLDVRNMPFGEARSYLAHFLFQGEDVFKQVGSCSGGERSRLALACLMTTKPNLLILDEPTTHFDIPSREALEQVLLGYDGTILLVSHDRHFVSLLAESLWVVGRGTVTPFRGTFAEWIESQSEAAKETSQHEDSRPARRAPRESNSSKKTSRPNPMREELMLQAIAKLEARMAELEGQLETASQEQDLVAVARLGQEYDETQAELEQRLKEWGG